MAPQPQTFFRRLPQAERRSLQEKQATAAATGQAFDIELESRKALSAIQQRQGLVPATTPTAGLVAPKMEFETQLKTTEAPLLDTQVSMPPSPATAIPTTPAVPTTTDITADFEKRLEDISKRKQELQAERERILREGETETAQLKRLRGELGIPGIEKSIEATLGDITKRQEELDLLEQDIVQRNLGVVQTGAQRRRQEAIERRPIEKSLQTLTRGLGSLESILGIKRQSLEDFVSAGESDLKRQKEIFNTRLDALDITPEEKQLFEIKFNRAQEVEQARRDEESAQLKTAEDKAKALDKGLEAIRSSLRTAKITMTTEFGNVVHEAERRVANGESVQSVLADVQAAVSDNPEFQAQAAKKVRSSLSSAGVKPEFQTSVNQAKSEIDTFRREIELQLDATMNFVDPEREKQVRASVEREVQNFANELAKEIATQFETRPVNRINLLLGSTIASPKVKRTEVIAGDVAGGETIESLVENL